VAAGEPLTHEYRVVSAVTGLGFRPLAAERAVIIENLVSPPETGSPTDLGARGFCIKRRQAFVGESVGGGVHDASGLSNST